MQQRMVQLMYGSLTLLRAAHKLLVVIMESLVEVHRYELLKVHIYAPQPRTPYISCAILCYRPVGNKFEMVWPYYSAMRTHNFLGHAHLLSPSPAARNVTAL